MNFDQISINNLDDYLEEAVIFIDQFSASQFQKLFKLKKALSLIESSINKAVKEQVDQYHSSLKIKEEGMDLNKKTSISKDEEEEEGED